MWIHRGQNGLWLVGAAALIVALVLWWRHKRRVACESGTR